MRGGQHQSSPLQSLGRARQWSSARCMTVRQDNGSRWQAPKVVLRGMRAARRKALDDQTVSKRACVVTLDNADDDESEETSGWVRGTFVAKHAGSHSLRVLVGGVELSGSPFTITFTAGALDPAQ